jgi:hypothetical protein
MKEPFSGSQSKAAVLPMGLGYVEGVTHDYVRHGTTTLFTALDVATGAVSANAGPGIVTRSSSAF